MAKLTWTFETPAGTVTRDSPLLDGTDPRTGKKHYERFLDWLWYAFPQLEADGETPKPRTPANEAKAWQDWAKKEWNRTSVTVRQWERREAAQALAIGDME